jgi:stage II sporulation protein R
MKNHYLTDTIACVKNTGRLLIKHWIEGLFVLSVAVFLLTYLVVDAQMEIRSKSQGLAESVIRFHVVANSDTTHDQLLKENVRDAVLDYMAPKLADSKDIDQTREILNAHLPQIKALSEQIVANWGETYAVNVELSWTEFPVKTYGDIVFPAGQYEACRILIGEAAGQNWWCVMFPPLCYVDATTGVVPLEGKEELKENLTAEQYEIIAYQSETPYKIKFKLLEWFK